MINQVVSEEDIVKLKDPKFFIERFFWVVDKDRKRVPFIFNPVQNKYYQERSQADLILKARKEGMTTLISAIWTHACLFTENARAVVISHEEDSTQRIFQKVRYFLDNMQSGNIKFKVDLEDNSKKQMSFPATGASFWIGTAGSTSFGRGDDITHLHCSEVPWWKNQEILTGVLEACVPSAYKVLESTANGVGEAFHRLWKQSKDPTSGSDWKRHFFPWFEDASYSAPLPAGVPIIWTPEELAMKAKYSLSDQQVYWYRKKRSNMVEKELILQEFPCLAGSTLVDSGFGPVEIRGAKPDGHILDHYVQGERQCYLLKTKLGYSVEATANHRFLTPDGFVPLEELKVGGQVVLGKYRFSDKPAMVSYSYTPFAKITIGIGPDFARFVGLYMGDGDYYDGCVGVSCDRQDQDLVDEVKRLFDMFFEGYSEDFRGTNDGCHYIRKSSVKLKDLFLQMGLIRRREGTSGYKRKICVPEFIMRSPKTIVAEFLRGLFEADGWISRDGNTTKLFSKYPEFIRQVQCLLLGFGIPSKFITVTKKSNGKYPYVGHELSMRKEATNLFCQEIGFLSSRKQARADLSLNRNGKHCNQIPLKLEDVIESITPTSVQPVYDVETADHRVIANGIVTHNCNDTEAFIASGRPLLPQDRLLEMEERASLPQHVGEITDDGYQVSWKPFTEGRFRIWKMPKQQERFLISADVAEGVKGGCFSVAKVFNRATWECVAQFRERLDPGKFGTELVNFARFFNNALLLPEMNNHGWATLERIKLLKYPHLVNTKDLWPDKAMDKVGFPTNERTRNLIFSSLLNAIEDRTYFENDIVTIQEMQSLVRDDAGKIVANEGYSDCAITAAIGIYALQFLTSNETYRDKHFPSRGLVIGSVVPSGGSHSRSGYR